MIDANADRIGLEDFSDGSTYIERFLEFWGDMIVKQDTNEETPFKQIFSVQSLLKFCLQHLVQG